MEEQNGIVDTTAAAAPNPHTNRRTAAIDVLTRALLSPPSISLSIQGKDSHNANRDESTIATEAEEAASNAVAAAASAARSFLDTTSSVYVLGADTTTSIAINTSATSPTNAAGGQSNSNHNDNMPKIFGCWNFLHQAMNEIERFEDEQNHAALTAAAAAATSTTTNNNINININTPPSLLSETRLLAEFAVKVARRSDDLDRQKVATCVENFCGSTTSNNAAASASASGKENANTDYTSSGNASSNDTNDRIPKGRLDANYKTDGTSTSNSTTTTTADSNSNITITNANHNSGRHDIHVLLPHLVRANAEIREIVTGRIAAFSLQPPSPLSMHSSSSNSTNISNTTAFADPLVVESFCRFLAANAVSNGAERLRRFLNDWIIPGATADDNSVSPSNAGASATTSTSPLGGKRQRLSPGGSNKRLLHHRLPPYSLACVLYHVATEAEMIPPSSSSEDDDDDDDSASASASSTATARTISPLGTIDVLQQLSLPVMANVLLGPVLRDALQSKQLKRQLKQHREHLQQLQQQQQQQPPSPLPEIDENGDDMDDRTIAMGLRAILKWCTATDLSLAQTKHIGSKVQVGKMKPQPEKVQRIHF